MRVVLDTNIFISALLASKHCRLVIKTFDAPATTLIISNAMIQELRTSLNKPKLTGLINDADKQKLIAFIRIKAVSINPKIVENICRDPKDNMVLATAVAAKANIIVTGDKDLLILDPFKRIEIIPPAKFLAKLNK